MAFFRKALPGVLALGAVVSRAEGTTTTIPGLTEAVNSAKSTATAMAGELVPAAVAIALTFAGIIGVWVLIKFLKRGAKQG